ncbi:PREDICTED: sialic acid-binding Ig-like lectin 15 [Corvus brachyrhynchos]|uniref:sialic acid-binding Ig-like lectin 15 n=1 Tax=Corvus brachyrhynchos TaxID=85066 RepID=UPI0008167881|nr:PREDICTED: sialic acid-binding Ig-like lectin 15 [Corvus brachyrhynchos]
MRELGLVLLCLLRISRKGVQCNGWAVHVPSDVTGELGKMVILPCTFTHPYKTFDRALTAIWRIKEPYNGTIVFKCVSQSSSELCKTAISHKSKYKLLGNPRHKDLSIRIDNLTWSDSERYFCRVELAGDSFFQEWDKAACDCCKTAVATQTLKNYCEVEEDLSQSVTDALTFTGATRKTRSSLKRALTFPTSPPARPQLPECTYENFDRRHGGSQTLPTGGAVPRRS